MAPSRSSEGRPYPAHAFATMATALLQANGEALFPRRQTVLDWALGLQQHYMVSDDKLNAIKVQLVNALRREPGFDMAMLQLWVDWSKANRISTWPLLAPLAYFFLIEIDEFGRAGHEARRQIIYRVEALRRGAAKAYEQVYPPIYNAGLDTCVAICQLLRGTQERVARPLQHSRPPQPSPPASFPQAPAPLPIQTRASPPTQHPLFPAPNQTRAPPSSQLSPTVAPTKPLALVAAQQRNPPMSKQLVCSQSGQCYQNYVPRRSAALLAPPQPPTRPIAKRPPALSVSLPARPRPASSITPVTPFPGSSSPTVVIGFSNHTPTGIQTVLSLHPTPDDVMTAIRQLHDEKKIVMQRAAAPVAPTPRQFLPPTATVKPNAPPKTDQILASRLSSQLLEEMTKEYAFDVAFRECELSIEILLEMERVANPVLRQPITSLRTLCISPPFLLASTVPHYSAAPLDLPKLSTQNLGSLWSKPHLGSLLLAKPPSLVKEPSAITWRKRRDWPVETKLRHQADEPCMPLKMTLPLPFGDPARMMAKREGPRLASTSVIERQSTPIISPDTPPLAAVPAPSFTELAAQVIEETPQSTPSPAAELEPFRLDVPGPTRSASSRESSAEVLLTEMARRSTSRLQVPAPARPASRESSPDQPLTDVAKRRMAARALAGRIRALDREKPAKRRKLGSAFVGPVAVVVDVIPTAAERLAKRRAMRRSAGQPTLASTEVKSSPRQTSPPAPPTPRSMSYSSDPRTAQGIEGAMEMDASSAMDSTVPLEDLFSDAGDATLIEAKMEEDAIHDISAAFALPLHDRDALSDDGGASRSTALTTPSPSPSLSHPTHVSASQKYHFAVIPPVMPLPAAARSHSMLSGASNDSTYRRQSLAQSAASTPKTFFPVGSGARKPQR